MSNIKNIISYSIRKCIRENNMHMTSHTHTDDIMKKLFIRFINNHDTVLRWDRSMIYIHTIYDNIEHDKDLYMSIKVGLSLAISSGKTEYILPPNHTSYTTYWITVLKVIRELRDSMWVSINLTSTTSIKIGMRWFW